jgi:hypothetical protein
MNLRIEGVHGAAAFSGGFAKCKKQVLDMLGLKLLPKTTGDRSAVDLRWYRVVQPGDREEFCFRDLGGYFFLNRTPHLVGSNNISRPRWGWNDNNCKKSVLRVNHL